MTSFSTILQYSHDPYGNYYFVKKNTYTVSRNIYLCEMAQIGTVSDILKNAAEWEWLKFGCQRKSEEREEEEANFHLDR